MRKQFVRQIKESLGGLTPEEIRNAPVVELDGPPEGFKYELNEAMTSMTYGKVPKKIEFMRHFKREVPSGEYNINPKGSDRRYAHPGNYTHDELYDLVKELALKWERGDEGAGDFASSILFTLDFEWI